MRLPLAALFTLSISSFAIFQQSLYLVGVISFCACIASLLPKHAFPLATCLRVKAGNVLKKFRNVDFVLFCC